MNFAIIFAAVVIVALILCLRYIRSLPMRRRMRDAMRGIKGR